MWAICELLQTNGYSIPSYGIKLRQRVAHQLLWGILLKLPAASAAAPQPRGQCRPCIWQMSMVGKQPAQRATGAAPRKTPVRSRQETS